MLSPYGNVSLASCRAYYDDKLREVLRANKTKKTPKNYLPESWMLMG